jgi:hypothetical protein
VFRDPLSLRLSTYFGLLSLLLGFTFAMALNRYDRRQLAVVDDSNSIGDFYTCASLLKEPIQTSLQTVIRRYAELHLRMARERLDRSGWEDALLRNQQMQDEMTKLVSDALAAGTPIAVSLTSTLDGLTSASSSRLAAVDDRVPSAVLFLLFAFAAIATALDGFEKGSLGSTSFEEVVGIVSLIVLVVLVVYVILDLDQPGRGLIAASQASMERLVLSIAK